MQWTTRVEETVVAGLGAALLVGAVPVVDTAGRVLVGLGAALLVGLVVHDLALAPRLRADDEQVVVRRLGAPTVIPRARLRARVRTGRRLGIRGTTLELEDTADETVLIVLGRRDLGADPERVGAVLLGHRPQV